MLISISIGAIKMTILDILATIHDSRRGQGQRYDLPNFLFISILAMLCGARTHKEISIFMHEHFTKLKKLLNLKWKQSPKKTMVNDTLSNINVIGLEAGFRNYSKQLLGQEAPVMPSLDGKTLRGSYDNKNGEKALHLLMAFCSNNKLILGHHDVTKDKTNEIPVAQKLIAELGLPEGAVYTLDALHCQKKLLQQ
jgi:hypothetical protein